jgi:hypothetical protein
MMRLLLLVACCFSFAESFTAPLSASMIRNVRDFLPCSRSLLLAPLHRVESLEDSLCPSERIPGRLRRV